MGAHDGRATREPRAEPRSNPSEARSAHLVATAAKDCVVYGYDRANS